MIPMLPSSLSRVILRMARARTGVDVFSKLHELKMNERLSLIEIEKMREKKIQILLEHAKRLSPFYGKRLEKLGREGGWGLDELRELDPVSKEELKRNVSRIVITELPARYRIAKTSGSTGIPLAFPKDCMTESYHYAAMYRGHSWYGLKPGDREARLWGIPVCFSERVRTRLKDYLLNRFREREYNLSEEILEVFYKRLLKYRPKYLMGYGGMLREFANYLVSTGRNLGKLNLRMVKYTSEGIQDGRAMMQRAFCCPVVCEYGAAETGIISFECPKGGQHIMYDCVHVDLVDGDAPYPYKEILVTDLNNLFFPIIRYRVGDIILPSKRECRCSLPFPVLGEIQGRTSEVFEIPAGKKRRKFHSIIFYYIMKECSGREKTLTQFRVVQADYSSFIYKLALQGPSQILED